jgi:2-dehydro-3-deoxyglucarate aldolase/4-hydroxy-2-oxoheptanedioate aldolase
MFDPARPRLRHRIDRGDCLGVAWLSLGSVAVAEAVGRSRPDAIVLDLQHGLWERTTMEAAIGVVPSEVPVLVRVAENSPSAIGQALDAGAEGVIVPLVETGKQARKAVEASRYPPHGNRSGGGVRPLADFITYTEAAERGIAVIPMIETARGLDNADRIARTEGVDMVFIGTGDLALSLGTFPNPDPRFESACEAIRLACRRAWTPCGIFTGSLEAAVERRSQGYRMVVTANDIDVMARGFNLATSGFAHARATAPAEPEPAAPVPLQRAAQ